MRAALAAAFAAGALAACGSGGGDTPKPADSANLFVKSISVPNYNGILLDEDIEYVLSAPVNEDSINPDSVQMRTGAQGGTAPFGVFVRGEFYVDPSTGTRVVVDPDKVTPSLINRVERGSAPLAAIPDIRRIDLGFDQPLDSNGGRRLLFNRAKRHIVTFIPEIPTRAALDDTGFTPGATYAVAVPGYPSTNTLENVAGAQLLSPNNRVFTSTFTCVPNTAGNLFLGAESAGPPRVIHTSPFNGEGNIPVTSPINIRFSHALDPRTVTPDKFKVELVSVAAPFPQIGVSVFLAQQRLGKIEVILTPINPLPPDGAIRVTIDSAIEDLVGQGLNQTSFSFFTGATVGPPLTDFIEEFVDTNNQSAAATTANWNNTKPYVGGAAGELVAAFAPYAGDGTDGAFAATVGSTIALSTGTTAQRVYNYTTFSIPIGATVVATGNFPLVVHCQGAADISGELQLNGSSGGHGGRGDSPTGPATGGQGGAGGPGGSRGGNGAFATTGAGGNFDGINGQAGGNGSGGGKGGFTGQNDAFPDSDPFWPRLKADGTDQSCVKTVANGQPQSFSGCRQRECGGGGGYLAPGGEGANKRATELSRDGATIPNGGNGGAAFGDAALATVYSTNLSVQVRDPNTGGLRTIVLNGIPTLGPGSGGSGGGGGGGEDDLNASSAYGTAGGEDEGGGGGGGGGGAFQLVSYTNINIAGRISCDGGIGGSSFDDISQTTFSQGAGGGGGSGGTIFLQCRSALSIQPGAILSVAGGVGGQGFADGTIVAYAGGTGSEGRIRLEDSDGNVVNAPAISSVGSFAPTLDLNSTAVSNWQDTFVFDPDFGQPTVDADHFPQFGINSSIQVFLEGAPENTLTTVSDPDTANSTGFIKVFDTNIPGGFVPGNPWDTLDQNKWWRFRIDFSVDGFHTFTDPLPTVRALTVALSN
jgi:hypothetical protein